MKAQLKPVLRLTDAELDGFDDLLTGAASGDVKDATLTVSPEAERVDLRGEEVTGTFTVLGVFKQELPTLTRELLDRLGVESEAALNEQIKDALTRPAGVQAAAGRPRAVALQDHRRGGLGPAGETRPPAD